MLQLAQELGNVSKACRIVGYSRQQFYEIRRNFHVHGADGLLDRLPGAKGPHPNRVPAAVDEAVLAHALEYPTHGAQRVAHELTLRGCSFRWSERPLPTASQCAKMVLSISDHLREAASNGGG